MSTGAPTASPPVSVLIVTWNRREDLLRSVESALAQTYPNLEVVVLDNASTDGSAEAVRSRFPDVRVICSDKNLGCPSGRNLGIVNCRGEYIYQLDDDGWLAPDAVEKSVRAMQADPEIAVVMSAIHEVEGEKVVRVQPPVDHPVYRHSFIGCCSMLRKSALDKVGLFPDDYWRQMEENHLALRLLDAGYYCYLQPESVMYHRPSPVGRDTSKFFYYDMRNINRTAMRLWPFPWCALKIANNFRHAAAFAVRRLKPLMPLKLLVRLIADLLALPGRRKPVRRDTLRLYRGLLKQPRETKPAARGPGLG